MSPIYVRPEREQAEHDRLIRYLQDTYSRKFEALANPGDERVAPVRLAGTIHFPDIVLADDKRLAGVVEIETAASVNNLEAMAKWVPFSRARIPFHLYVPVQGYETALRLIDAFHVRPAEIWTYRSAVEGFDLVRMFADPALQNLKPLKTGLVVIRPTPPPPPPPAADPVKAEPERAVVADRKPKAAPKAQKPAATSARKSPPAKSSPSSKKPAKAAKKAAKKSVKAVSRKVVRKAKAPARKAAVRKAAKPARKIAKAKPARKGPKARKKTVRKHR